MGPTSTRVFQAKLRPPLDAGRMLARAGFPKLEAIAHARLVLVNGLFVPPQERESHALRDGDVLAIWPPIAGG